MLIADVLSVLAAFIFMLTINVPLTLIFFGMFPVLAALQIFISMPIQKRQATLLEASEKFNTVVNDSLQNTSTIIAYGLEDTLEQRYLSTYEEFMRGMKSYALALLPLILAGQLVSMIPIFTINLMAAFAVIDGNISIAQFIALTAIALNAGSALLMLSQRLSMVQTNAAGAARFKEKTAAVMENLHSGSKFDASQPASISFKNVSFTYGEDDDAPLALNDVTFTIEPGSKVAFVGGSGSGKSTVLKLLLGLYAAQSGEIVIAGQNAAHLSKSGLRDIFAYVPQDSFLFPQSIGKNIALDGVDDAQHLEKTCREAGIWDFVQSLPNKFDGVLSEGSENISGGQRQRIALARAFYKDTPVILNITGVSL